MLNLLPTLHDADNRRLGLVFPVLGNLFVGFFIFLFCLLELDLIDLDAELVALEVRIEGEDVGLVDVFTSRSFVEHVLLDAGKGLKGADEFAVGCLGI